MQKNNNNRAMVQSNGLIIMYVIVVSLEDLGESLVWT